MKLITSRDGEKQIDLTFDTCAVVLVAERASEAVHRPSMPFADCVQADFDVPY